MLKLVKGYEMNVTMTEIPDVLILEPKVFGDNRGFSSRVLTRKPLMKFLVEK
jgi:dTDP-4-dehydrorhamnose 3,5-epimerase-like enzyme